MENDKANAPRKPLMLNGHGRIVTFEAFWKKFGHHIQFSPIFNRLILHELVFMPTFFLRRLARLWLLALPAMLFFSSCASTQYYHKRTLFRLTDSQGKQLDSTKLRIAVNRSERNYVIQPNDFLEVRVNTNKGERILDPNGELQFGMPSGALPSRGNAVGNQSSSGTTQSTSRGTGQGSGATTGASEFLVQADGIVVLPMVGRIRLSGLSLLQADSVLAIRFNEYYKDAFVSTRVTNNRVIMLGAAGGKVIQLANDNMNLLEVLALAGGIDGAGGSSGFYRNGGRADNIRIIRGNLKNPRVQQVDLSTLDGMRRASLQIEPNDIIYVEPIRRPLLDALADAGPVLSLTSLLFTTTFFLISQFKK